MRSSERRLPTLQSRVALASAAAAALVGLVAASTSAFFVQRQQRRAADLRLIDAAQLFAAELTDSQQLKALADEEDEELAPLSIHLALFSGTARVGGATNVLPGAADGCLSHEGQRTCTVSAGPHLVVVRSPDVETPPEMLPWAIVLATALSALGGALASRALAKWALGPLDALRQKVAGVTLTEKLELGPAAPTEEVEALRGALGALVQRLREAAERARLFASGAAHELKTPLATMSAELELALTAPPAELALAVQRASRMVRRLTIQVDRLLSLARGDEGAALANETIALEDVAREAITNRSQLEVKRLSLTVADPGMVRGDGPLLCAIADNLIDNALKFSGERPVRVHVAARAEHVLFTVTDDGPGIAADRVAQLLQPFVRGQTAQLGHGLGLAIVQHAVERHGGKLEIAGATVTVWLPRWVAAPRPSPADSGPG